MFFYSLDVGRNRRQHREHHGVDLDVDGESVVDHPGRKTSRTHQVRDDAQGDDRGGEADGQDTRQQPRRFELESFRVAEPAGIVAAEQRRVCQVAFTSG
jgi:hypothetical protein